MDGRQIFNHEIHETHQRGRVAEKNIFTRISPIHANFWEGTIFSRKRTQRKRASMGGAEHQTAASREGRCRADFPVCRLGGFPAARSSEPGLGLLRRYDKHGTGKFREPADWKVCPTIRVSGVLLRLKNSRVFWFGHALRVGTTRGPGDAV
jgi:hypothetical protein